MLSNIAEWSTNTLSAAGSSCDSACGAAKPAEPEKKPAACGSACGAAKPAEPEKKPAACGSACGASKK